MVEIKNLGYENHGRDSLCGLSFCTEDKGAYGILIAREKQRRIFSSLICGCINASSGEISINGELMSRNSLELKKRVRLVPEKLIVDSSSTLVEYLDFIGQALNIEPEKRYRQIKEALELVGIDSLQNRLIRYLNDGELCRLAVAGALMGNPDVLVFDDPFYCLDESTRKELYSLVEMLSSIKTLFIVSHSVKEIKQLCSRVLIVSNGKTGIDGKISEIEEKINTTREAYISVRGEADAIIEAIKTVESVVGAKITSTESNGVHSVRVEHYPDDNIKETLFDALSSINAPMLSIRAITLTLEDVYFSLTSDETDDEEAVFEERKIRTKAF